MSLALAACGNDDSSAESKEPEAATAPANTDDRSGSDTQETSAETQPRNLPTQVKLTKPVIEPPDTLPTELVIRDISKGVDPAARSGDELAIEYHAVDEAGKTLYSSWDNTEPSQLRMAFGSGKYFNAFEESIEGMKVGARREFFIPATLTEELGPLFYVVDLLEINRKGKCWSAQSLDQAPPSRKAKIHERCKTRVRVL